MKNNRHLQAILIVIMALFTICCSLDSQDTKTLEGNGNVISQERNATGFNSIIHNGLGNANIHTNENFKVMVTTDSNIQDIIIITVKGKDLHIDIKDKNGLTGFKPTDLSFDVYLPELQSISLKGGGEIKVSDVKASDFELNLSGVGNITAQGIEAESVNVKHSGGGNIGIGAVKTPNFEINLSGVGNIDAQGIEAENVNIKHSGGGNIRIDEGKASNLELNLSGVGNIDTQSTEAENVNIIHSGGGDIKIWVTKNLAINLSGVGNVFYKGNPSINIINIDFGGSVKKL